MIEKNNPRYSRTPKKASKTDCAGCEDDFYNDHNEFGVKECWHFPSAIMIMRKEVPVDQRPPWTQAPKLFASCFHRKRYVYVSPDRVD